jgi:hypothetical protein
MKKFIIFTFTFFAFNFSHADTGVVIKRFANCDYYIVDGPKGLYVLEWFGGFDPSEGDKIIGNIGIFGIKEVFFPKSGRKGKVWVEDFLLSTSSALEKIKDKCF